MISRVIFQRRRASRKTWPAPPKKVHHYSGCGKFFLLPLFAALFLPVSFAAGCQARGTQPRLGTLDLSIEKADGNTAGIRAEIARSGAEHERGLMFRERLADGEGMLFVFGEERILFFWMKNTLIPLSIAFISSSGRILEIRDMRPHDTNTVNSGSPVRYALEVPQGWFGRAGIRPGDFLRLDPLLSGGN